MRHILALLLITCPASAGGFFLMMLGQPTAHPDARSREAAFTVGITGCGARGTTVTATAEGVVNGQRLTIPLKVTPLAGERSGGLRENAAGLMDQFPSFAVAVSKMGRTEGVWVIHVVGRASWGQEQHALVRLGGEGIDRAKTRQRTEPFSAAEITAALIR